MTTILAIDPGNIESGWCLIDADTRQPVQFGKSDNQELLRELFGFKPDHSVIEMVASYGMPVGAEVFETCVWIGVFSHELSYYVEAPALVKRQPVKLHHCHSTQANDATVKQALVDRFAPGASNYGKGTKDAPGWFHGFRADIWQAYALAVYAADVLEAGQQVTG